MPHEFADFRSDTVTRPTPAMRKAMAEALVGDDVFQEDPTVAKLEAEAARLLGKEASLFVPTGCMGNQIAVRVHTRPGEEVCVEAQSHTYDWELAGMAALSGVQARPLPSVRGALDPELVGATLREEGGFRPRCGLVIVENTHNFHGGAVVPIDQLRRVYAAAKDRRAAVHMDGARLWNAAVASNTPLSEYGRVADSITVCLSKGLGAPVGSLVAGDAAFVAKARVVRKLLGGGMRQVGVLAAPALLALRENRARLVEDHRRAQTLAMGLCEAARTTLPGGPPDTNIVIVRVEGLDPKAIADALKARQVLALQAGPDRLRFVTHYDVDDGDVTRAITAFQDVVRTLAG